MARPTRFPGSTFMRQPPPGGFGIQFLVNDDLTIFARFAFDAAKEGPPGYAHGGAVGAVLDEAMGTATFEAGRIGFTATMTVNYRAAVPLHTAVEVRGRVERVDGSKTHAAAEILLPDGSIAATSTGIFVKSEKLLEQVIRYYGRQDT
ncbi:MAG: PaaI family thioesterase [Anaerolineae bacterium]|jgi:acyl-coenzyme A thioesterase PaaI-like protein|nr:PaaI family thioesterase [Anaerolineae bacterium]